jgi:hypothetical protein
MIDILPRVGISAPHAGLDVSVTIEGGKATLFPDDEPISGWG